MQLSRLIVLCALFGTSLSAPLYESNNSDVAVYSQLNFEKQVTKSRDKGISIVHYYKDSDGKSSKIKKDYDEFASGNKGIFRIGSCNCDDHPKICANEKVDKFPTIRVYPQFPAPTQDLDMEKPFEQKNLKKLAGRFISDKTIEITQNNHKTFVEENVQTPKVLLFTNSKKGTPFMFRALSQHFEKTLEFGIVRESEDAIAKKYKVKKYPSVFVIKSEGKPIQYSSDKFNYQDLFEFINVHSQIFVDPNAKDNQPKQNSASKPWLTKSVAEITKDSGNDICLKKDGALCVFMVVKDKSQVTDAALEVLNNVGQQFDSKIARGIQFFFSYLDASAEPEFAKTFGLEEKYPSIIVLNPGKRKRFLIHEGDVTEEAIEATLDKILGGDARFKNIKGNKLPELVSSYPEE